MSSSNKQTPKSFTSSLKHKGDRGLVLSASNLEKARQKVLDSYRHEPSTEAEISTIIQPNHKRSQHQQFMYNLSTSGRSLAEIQKAWHEYYAGLTDVGKHEVWQEFYEANKQAQQAHNPHSETIAAQPHPAYAHHVGEVSAAAPRQVHRPKKTRSQDARMARQHKPARHSFLRPVVFGLGMGSLTMIVLLFGFFNERVLAPLITPSRTVSSTPIIVDPNSSSMGIVDQRVIIPKINVEVPVVYDEPSVAEKALQQALERGVVHYASTSKPGETGNTVIFGHSSNNILNKGKYKFAFVLLNRLEINDTFMLTHEGKRYVYRISDKRIVKPTDFSVLETTNRGPTATLITCDPPGTSLNRLIVIGEQVSPDPATAVASSAKISKGESPKVLPSNSPSLWQRIRGWFTS